MKSKLSLEVRRKKALRRAWIAVQRNARNSKSEITKKEIAEFAVDSETQLDFIQRELKSGTFKFPPAKGVKVPKDKKDRNNFRPLVVAKVESRIVQRAIHDVLVTVPAIKKFVHTPHSFGGVKKVDDDELSAVPAAVQEVLNAIAAGGQFIIRSDIRSFFTRIPKPAVTKIVSDAVHDPEFVGLFSRAIAVELENLDKLRGHADQFPIYEIGVAQGNSLSPLLGNLLLHGFDAHLNKDRDVRCLRYIDDFIIVAPSRDVAENTFAVALRMLADLGMEVSKHKTQRAPIDAGFEFLGIEFANGLLRPAKKSREKLLNSVAACFAKSAKAFHGFRNTKQLDIHDAFIGTLARVAGIVQGWGKHYHFCNDGRCFSNIDAQIDEELGKYFGLYRDIYRSADALGRWKILGIEGLSQIERSPFRWPGKAGTVSS